MVVASSKWPLMVVVGGECPFLAVVSGECLITVGGQWCFLIIG